MQYGGEDSARNVLLRHFDTFLEFFNRVRLFLKESMVQRNPKFLAQKCKLKQHSGEEKETKDKERLKKKELRKQSAREKDYGTTEEKSFSAALNSIQMKIKYMDGDGNCLFRSIADQLTGKCSNVSGKALFL